MSDNTKSSVVAACRRFMRPVARLLIKSGISCKEFSEICRMTFVEVALEDYGLSGRPTNSSRVGILTGLSRREVRRLRQALEEDHKPHERGTVSVASRVLGGWHQDADFLDAHGKPIELPASGPGPAFETLLERYAGDMPPGALLKELIHVDAVAETEDGLLRVKKRYYMPAQLDALGIERSGTVLADFGKTVVHNLVRDPKVSSRFEGRASNRRISRKAVEEFRILVEERGDEFLYAIDDWLSKHEIDDDTKTADAVRLGVGVYSIE